MMKDRNLLNANMEQVQDLQSRLTDCVVHWCKDHDCAGSTADYNLYAAVQQAVSTEARQLTKVDISRERQA